MRCPIRFGATRWFKRLLRRGRPVTRRAPRWNGVEQLEPRVLLDNTLGTATNLGLLDTPLNTAGSVSGMGDMVDHFRFTVDTQVREVTVTAETSVDDIIFDVIRDNNMNGIVDGNDVIDSVTIFNSNTPTNILLWLDPGDYFVRVSPRTATDNANYTLNLGQQPRPDSLGEGDNTLPTADPRGDLIAPLMINDFVGQNDLDDFFAFSVSGSVREVTLTAETLMDDAVFALIRDHNSNGIVDGLDVLDDFQIFNANTPDFTTLWLDPGNYFVQVTPRTSQDNPEYNLTLSQVPQAQSTGEATNTPPTAQPLGDLQAPIDITDFVGRSDDIDFYAFTISGSVREVTATVTTESEDVIIDLIQDKNTNGFVDNDEDLDVVTLFNENTPTSISAWLDPGSYFVRVRQRINTDNTQYDLNLSQIPQAQSTGTNNNDLPNAQGFGNLIAPVNLTDYVGPADLEDIYSFNVTDHVREVTVTVTQEEDDLDIELVADLNTNGMVDAGEIVDSLTIFNENLPFQIGAWLDPGEYFVRIKPRTDDAETQYDLNISQQPQSQSLGNGDNLVNDAPFYGGGTFTDYVGPNDLADIYAIQIPIGGATFSAMLNLEEDDVIVDLAQDGNSNNMIDPGEIINTVTIFNDTGGLNQFLAAGDYVVSVVPRVADSETQYSITLDNIISPDIVISGNGIPIANGDLTAGGPDGTNLGEVDVDGGMATQTFEIRNDGLLDLLLFGSPVVMITGSGAPAFHVSAQPASLSLETSATTTFDITFDPSTTGLKVATIEIFSNDGVATPYKFTIGGNAVTTDPDINVTGNALPIPDGDTTPDVADGTDFGEAGENLGSVTRTFTIENTGNEPLVLAGANPVSVGSQTGDFAITAAPASLNLAPGGTTTFDVTFAPTQTGAQSGTVSIGSNDPDENPYTFDVSGNGIEVIPPVAVDDTVATTVNQQVMLNVLANDTDADGTIDPTTVVITQAAQFGTVDVDPVTGVVTYTPNSTATGTDTFRYTVRDNDGFVSNEASARITVNRVSVTRNGELVNDDEGQVDFGQVGQGNDPVGIIVRVTNIDNQPISIAQIDVPDGFIILNINGIPFSPPLQPQLTGPNGGPAQPAVLQEVGPFDLMPGQSLDIELAVDPDQGSGVAAGVVTVKGMAQNGDDIEYDFNVMGEVLPLPDIALGGNGVEIFNSDVTPSLADGTDFGVADLDDGLVTHTFTIGNVGSETLNLTGTPRVEIGGFNAGDFSVVAQPDAVVASAASVNFQITFDPSALGVRNATVSIASDDPNEDPFTFAITGTGAVTPDIEVRGDGVPIADGDTTPEPADDTDFGAAIAGQAGASHVFDIFNDGSGVLNLTGSPNVVITGPNAADFTVTSQPGGSSIDPDDDTSFTIQFAPLGGGTRRATVSIESDDPDESPYTFDIQGEGTGPEITLLGNGLPINNNDDTPDPADHTEFGNADVQLDVVTRTFTIMNDGSDPLTLNGAERVAISGAHVADFAVTDLPDAVIAAGGSTTFDIEFDPSDQGLRQATLTIESDDFDEPTFVFDIVGTGTVQSEIDVLGGGVLIMNGDVTPGSADGTDFGPADTLLGMVMRTFTVLNTGLDDLLLTGSPAVDITGPAAADFAVSLAPDLSVPGSGGSTTFDITFDPSAQGDRDATVTILNNDGDENPFTFDITGQGVQAPEIDIRGNGLTIVDGDDTPEVADDTDFGGAKLEDDVIDIELNIHNIGSADLSLTGTPRVSMSGPDAGDFQVLMQPGDDVIAPGGQTSFTIRFDPFDLGTRTATVTVESDDIDEGVYTFDISAEGLPNQELLAEIGDGADSNKATVTDDNQNEFDVNISGAGTAMLFDDGGRITIKLVNTTDRTNITVRDRGDGDAALQNFEADGPVKNANLRGIGIAGDILIAGLVGSINVGDVADQHTIMFGGTPSDRGVRATFGVLTDVTIISGAPFQTFTAVSINDTDDVKDSITAPSARTVNIRGDRRTGDPGDMDADLIFDGSDGANQTVGNLKVAGGAHDIDVNIIGDTGNVQFGGPVTDSTFTVMSQVRNLRFDIFTNVTVDADELGNVQGIEWNGGALNATTTKNVTIKGNTRDGIEGNLNIDVTITGDPGARQAFGNLRVTGGTGGSVVNVTGDTGNIQYRGNVDDLHLMATGEVRRFDVGVATNTTVEADSVGSVQAVAWPSGALTARSTKTIRTTGRGAPGDFGAAVNVTGDPDERTVVNSVNIKDTVLGTSVWNVNGPMGNFLAGAILDGFAITVNGDWRGVNIKGAGAGTYSALTLSTFNVKDSFLGGVFVGAYFGADGVLGGGDDLFMQGELRTFKVGSTIGPTTVLVGIDPVNSVFNDGDDVLLGGEDSSMRSFSINGTAADGLLVIAGELPRSVSINRERIDPLTDDRFRNTPVV